ncbi:hypothetical protein [Gordonia soli]|uniref:Uncharacterized protein n=1 Tax=Gordonia soli NBRC 108243 TaxID=1223545 RepID=M0QF61_9ACTN|nr:hypothetical protein [Gordonia soli]GAC66931.1 hypothetical protein GS4_05_01420 [Gordonia soli NBRC 108243]
MTVLLLAFVVLVIAAAAIGGVVLLVVTLNRRRDTSQTPIPPVVGIEAPRSIDDAVYRSVQTVRFADGRVATFASTTALAPGTPLYVGPPMGPPSVTVGGLLVDFVIPAPSTQPHGLPPAT